MIRGALPERRPDPAGESAHPLMAVVLAFAVATVAYKVAGFDAAVGVFLAVLRELTPKHTGL
jgi:hypothetical protein